jgi:Fe-S-cluster containining protein
VVDSDERTRWSLTERFVDPHGFDCILLDRDKVEGKGLCRVYDARPEQCRTWPWWSKALESRETWEAAKPGCEGIGEGELHSAETILAKTQHDSPDPW